MPAECRLLAITGGAAVADLTSWEYIAFDLIFLWSGFVRSGLSFRGAALALPLLLLVVANTLTVIEQAEQISRDWAEAA